MSDTIHAPTLDDLAVLFGCDPSDVPARVVALAGATIPPPPFTPRPHPLRYNRKTQSHKIAQTRQPDRVARTHERRAKVWQLRKLHLSLDAISKEVGVSVRAVRADLKWWFEALVPPDVEERRAVELDAIDQMSFVFAKLALKGDTDAAREWRALRKHYADLCGLTKVAPPIQIGPTVDQWNALLDAVEAHDAPSTARGNVIDVDPIDEILGELES